MKFTLQNVLPTFPVGTEVEVYEKANWRTERFPDGGPLGSAVTTGEVQSDGSVEFDGLEPETSYYAYAKIGDDHRYVAFGTYAPKGDVRTAGKGFVFHGDDPDVPRPQGFASVEWIGSVEPANAADGDTWIDLGEE